MSVFNYVWEHNGIAYCIWYDTIDYSHSCVYKKTCCFGPYWTIRDRFNWGCTLGQDNGKMLENWSIYLLCFRLLASASMLSASCSLCHYIFSLFYFFYFSQHWVLLAFAVSSINVNIAVDRLYGWKLLQHWVDFIKPKMKKKMLFMFAFLAASLRKCQSSSLL